MNDPRFWIGFNIGYGWIAVLTAIAIYTDNSPSWHFYLGVAATATTLLFATPYIYSAQNTDETGDAS